MATIKPAEFKYELDRIGGILRPLHDAAVLRGEQLAPEQVEAVYAAKRDLEKLDAALKGGTDG